MDTPKTLEKAIKTCAWFGYPSFHCSMASKKAIGKFIVPIFCVQQHLGVIGFCLYKLYSDSEKTELWLAIICSVLGCVSSKAHLSTKTKREDVILPSSPVRLES